MSPENHDILTTLVEKVGQIEKRENARGQREFVLVGGIVVALVNAFLERFTEVGAVDTAAALIGVIF